MRFDVWKFLNVAYENSLTKLHIIDLSLKQIPKKPFLLHLKKTKQQQKTTYAKHLLPFYAKLQPCEVSSVAATVWVCPT